MIGFMARASTPTLARPGVTGPRGAFPAGLAANARVVAPSQESLKERFESFPLKAMGSTEWRLPAARAGALALLVVLVLPLPIAGQDLEVAPADSPAPGQVLNVAVHPFDTEGPTIVQDKVPLLEVFTATWCPPCQPSHNAVERLMDEHSPGLGVNNNASDAPVRLGLLSYHPFPDIGQEDPFGIPEGHNRLEQKHGVFWFPSAIVDGVLEDAPETRSNAVDVGMEDVFYNSYTDMIRSTQDNDPPFVLSVHSERVEEDPATWDVTVRVEATRPIENPLSMQGVLWEDHKQFAGSNGVERHRMIVRAMASEASSPERLAEGEVWEETLRLVAPAAVDAQQAGVSVIVEAPWGEERDERAVWFFGLALFVMGGTAVTAGWQIHAQNRRRGAQNARGGEAQEPGP